MKIESETDKITFKKTITVVGEGPKDYLIAPLTLIDIVVKELRATHTDELIDEYFKALFVHLAELYEDGLEKTIESIEANYQLAKALKVEDIADQMLIRR